MSHRIILMLRCKIIRGKVEKCSLSPLIELMCSACMWPYLCMCALQLQRRSRLSRTIICGRNYCCGQPARCAARTPYLFHSWWYRRANVCSIWHGGMWRCSWVQSARQSSLLWNCLATQPMAVFSGSQPVRMTTPLTLLSGGQQILSAGLATANQLFFFFVLLFRIRSASEINKENTYI